MKAYTQQNPRKYAAPCNSRSAQDRRRLFAEARDLRRHLEPIMSRAAIGKALGISRAAVEQLELRALRKVILKAREMFTPEERALFLQTCLH